LKKEQYTVFRQSLYDFPCPVSLGKYTPSFSLSRYKQGLRFVPSDDDGFTLRGDKQRLVYKGRRRSHRFTILGDTSFEYDCILKKEPESNVISLRMEGAENFDFFRQPDFVEEPFLKGSYAVYKKNTMVGEGTGKLCHIHRPEIIDARGRRCWGELSVVGNELRITIPEQWLGEAKYPVIVDPTLGTTTVGSQITGPNPNDNSYDRPTLDSEFALNKYLVPQNGNGLCNAYVYCYDAQCDWDFLPCIYTNVNNKPYARKSKNENTVDVTVSPPRWPVGWNTDTFRINGSLTAGDYIWFGGWAHYFWTRFDYGGDCYKGQFDDDLYEDYIEEYGLAPYIVFNSTVSYCNIIWSWYFTYTGSGGQNYVRTLTQGVTISDNWIITGNYRRITTNTVKAEATPIRHLTILKRIQDTLGSLDLVTKTLSIIASIKDTLNSFELSKITFLHFRNINEVLNTSDTLCHLKNIILGLYETVGTESEVRTGFFHFRVISETAHVVTYVFRGMVIFARIVTVVFVRDYLLGRFLKARTELALKSCVCREIVLESKIGE
jgi:hypothetical protein